MTSRLGTGTPLTFFLQCMSLNSMGSINSPIQNYGVKFGMNLLNLNTEQMAEEEEPFHEKLSEGKNPIAMSF